MYSKYSNSIYIWLMLQNSYIKCIYCLYKYLISQWACNIVKCLRHRPSNINVQYLWKEIDFKLKRYLGMDTNAFSLITTHLILYIVRSLYNNASHHSIVPCFIYLVRSYTYILTHKYIIQFDGKFENIEA